MKMESHISSFLLQITYEEHRVKLLTRSRLAYMYKTNVMLNFDNYQPLLLKSLGADLHIQKLLNINTSNRVRKQAVQKS